MTNIHSKLILSIIVIFLLTIAPAITSYANNTTQKNADFNNELKTLAENLDDKLDARYVYNITEALSNIMFTAYTESNGEIAKGRAFGTKGEHKAAEILFENLTDLGLYTKLEPISKRPGRIYDENAYKLEVLDYNVELNGKNLDSLIHDALRSHKIRSGKHEGLHSKASRANWHILGAVA